MKEEKRERITKEEVERILKQWSVISAQAEYALDQKKAEQTKRLITNIQNIVECLPAEERECVKAL